MEEALPAILEKNKKSAENKTTASSKKIVADYISQIKNFESDRIEYIKKQNKMAWRVAGAFAAIALIAIIALMSLAPFKTVTPYVIRVDNNTGHTDVIKPMSNSQESYSEKLNKFWLQNYVTNREAYYWETIQQSFEEVKLTSNQTVFTQYETAIYSDNSPLKKFENMKSVRVEINGSSFITTSNSVVAQVRFTKTVIEKDGKAAIGFPVTNWMATATFDYNKEIKRENEEQVNPLGFQVTSYRADQITD
ncbi:conjugal transfer protein TraJ [Shewanella sairae]|uniref:Conjugal transfer protein TraJ n=1 Tax=Shewanella sairae TaxID=190310 RepID=A0ABQ4PLJ4_9GAMM|nr:type IV secretion system protein [Shewanella sairae]MCL1131890.1 type IV secretion system protein [Shewanella sairae]GIU48863.1 conjugal transfer protein TraJ [Shewanella sairae]